MDTTLLRSRLREGLVIPAHPLALAAERRLDEGRQVALTRYYARRQGLLAGRWCLDPGEDLSPGQVEEIDRVCAAYPHLSDDDFVRENLHRWLQ